MSNNEQNYNFWWIEKREELLEISRQNDGNCYVYNLETIQNKIVNLKELALLDNILFAIKSNNNPEILKVIEQASYGFECVSIQEVQYVIELFPKIDRKRILFTPNFSPKEEYIRAFEYGVNVTIDSTYPLLKWSEIFDGKEILLRIDTGISSGHHKYVHTGGNESKFGIPFDEITNVLNASTKYNFKIIGLHAHAGSGILATETWGNIAKLLETIVDNFPDLKIIDLGGGLGIPEKTDQIKLNLTEINKSLELFKENHPNLKIWMEPGRFFVAEAGVLLSKVTQIKKKNDIYYVGISAGMNSLIRPALYNSYHEIINLSRMDEKEYFLANIVGPICESGDFLGKDRKIPKSTEFGDTILIATAGAYGQVMSSNYTMRPRPDEIIIG